MMKNGIFVTGATGFLGIHIIRDLVLLKKEVFCLVRGSSEDDAKGYFEEKLRWYFGSECVAYSKYIKVVCGDFSKEKFGLSDEEYEGLINRIFKVIHIGALVKHFGKKDEYDRNNILATKYVIDFCKRSNAYLLYTSSVAVLSCNDDSEANWTYQREDKVDLYVFSKIQSEKMISKAMSQGLKASIVRIGALFSRYSDGLFQQNISENALSARVKTMLVSGKLPSDFIDKTIDFLPVDLCSTIITTILLNDLEGYFCVYNNNTITYGELINEVEKFGYHVEPKEYSNYIELYNDLKEYSIKDDLITGFYLHYRRRKNQQKKKKEYKCELTEALLKQYNIELPQITSEYIWKVINYMKKIGYIC